MTPSAELNAAQSEFWRSFEGGLSTFKNKILAIEKGTRALVPCVTVTHHQHHVTQYCKRFTSLNYTPSNVYQL